MKRILSLLCILALMGTLLAGIPATAAAIDGLGENWSSLSAEDTAVYTKGEDGYTISGANWWTGAVYSVAAGADCTVDMTFASNGSTAAWWGIYARLNSTDPLEDMTPTVGNAGVRGMVTPTDVSIHAAEGTVTKTAEDGYVPYNLAAVHTLRLVCQGADIKVYLDDMENPLLTSTTTKLDGGYVGFYAPNANNCVIQSIAVNGETILTGEEVPPRPHSLGENWSFLSKDDNAVYTKGESGYAISGSGWTTGAAYAVAAGADCTVEMTFSNNGVTSAWWGVYARLNSTAPLADMTPTVGDTGVRGVVTLADTYLNTPGESVSIPAGEGYTPYDPATTHTIRLVCQGAEIKFYLDDMENPLTTATTTKLDGDYIGFYAANVDGCVIQSISVNGSVILGDVPSGVHSLTATAGADGWIAPSSMEVEHGEKAVFQLIPQKGYEVDEITVNGQPAELTAPRSFTISSVNADAAIHATFRPVDPMDTDRWHPMAPADSTENEDTSVLTMTEEGGFTVSDSNWWAGRVFTLPIGADGTVEMTFSNNGVNSSWWGVFARLDSTDTVLDMVPTAQEPQYGIRADVTPGWAAIYAPGETPQLTPEDGYVPFDPNVTNTMRLVCEGENVELYLNDMETPILTAVTTKLDGDYAGIYFPNSNGCVINSVKINGEIIMGYESWSRPLDDTAVYSQPADADVTLEMGFVPTAADQVFGLCARLDGTDSVTSWEAVSGGGQGVGVSFSTSGGLRIGEEHWDITQEAAVLNRMHILRMTLSGSSVKASIDGLELASTTTERLAGSFVGYRAPVNSAAEVLYFKVDEQIILGDEIFVMSATAGEGGSVKPEYAAVIKGESHTYTIVPDEGYAVDTALLDGQAVTLNGLKYTVVGVEADHEFQVTFRKAETFTVTATAGEGGSVSPASAEVTEGGSHTVTITPDAGYAIDQITLDGETAQASNGKLVLSDVRADHAIHVTFRRAVVYGEVDGKEGIDASDALKVLQHTVQLITLDENQRMAADVNADDNINATDALYILQYTVDLISKFPAEE